MCDIFALDDRNLTEPQTLGPKPAHALCSAVRQVTDFFTLNHTTLATVEMKNMMIINQCAMKNLPGRFCLFVGWLVGWLVGLAMKNLPVINVVRGLVGWGWCGGGRIDYIVGTKVRELVSESVSQLVHLLPTSSSSSSSSSLGAKKVLKRASTLLKGPP